MNTERIWFIRTAGPEWTMGTAYQLQNIPDEEIVDLLRDYCHRIGEKLIAVCRSGSAQEALKAIYGRYMKL